MTDQEELMKVIECCLTDENNCWDCPYCHDSIDECQRKLHDGVIALLKEQEAKQAIKHTYYVMIKRDYENPVEVTHYEWLCPTCKSLLCRDIDVIDDNYHFCKVCGQAVKWDD